MKAKEPTKTVKQEGMGRPEYSDEQYQAWLEEMRPWLRQGSSLNYAIDKAGLVGHRITLYNKYRLNDWFSEKVDALRATVGEMVNAVGFKVIEGVHTRMIESDGKTNLTTEETRIWQTMAEKHRSAQPFFVNRTESAVADPNQVGKILDTLDGKSNYDNLGPEIKKQSVAHDAPVQDQEQSGGTDDVPAEPNTTTTSS